jgi:predicted nucleic-acid-binding Zn-ribbon protein
MQTKEHVKLSAAAAALALPWIKKDIWIPFSASILIDVDHYIWYAVTHRSLSLKEALRFFNQADPPQTQAMKFLHQPLTLGLLLFLAIRLRSRTLALILAGFLFHVSLDVIHVTQMSNLKRTLGDNVQHICPECGKEERPLQLHTKHYASNILDKYNPEYFVVLCGDCHAKLH